MDENPLVGSVELYCVTFTALLQKRKVEKLFKYQTFEIDGVLISFRPAAVRHFHPLRLTPLTAARKKEHDAASCRRTDGTVHNIMVSMILTSECLVSTVPAKHAERSQC
jgi:hypothetical protein